MRFHERARVARTTRWLVAAAAVAVLSACGGDGSAGEGDAGSGWTTLGTRSEQAAPNPVVADEADGEWSDYDPPAEYPERVTRFERITMADGTELAATVVLPADADGNAVSGPLPTLVTLTGYNKAVGAVVPVLGGANPYFVSHGYAHVSVDVRGTGASDGRWRAFGEAEQSDYRPVLDWVAEQPFCNGDIGLYGASLLGITSLFAAADDHPAVKALFPMVPMGDAYRDIVFTGGQVNVGFIPLWLGLVTGLSVLDPNLIVDPVTGLQHAVTRVFNAVAGFQVPTVLRAVAGDPDTAYDGDFWATRSPIEQAGNIDVPTFVVGGLKDIFQRGEPLLYEALKDQTEAKLLIGPWEHIQIINTGLPAGGVPELDHIALRWFDQYVKGEAVGAERMPNVTQYVLGHDGYVASPDWPHPEASAERMYLRGDRTLTEAEPETGESGNRVVQQPLGGICSPSTSQWTAGALGLLPLPCLNNDNLSTALHARYTTAPLSEDLYINGPIQANVWISTTSRNAGVSVRVSDVGPGGRAKPISNGLLTGSFRAVDESRSRYLDGLMIQPWHPFTRESRELVGRRNPVLLRVEVFPTSALIEAGHRLRISVGPSDFPHGLPPLPDLATTATGVMTVLSDPEHASHVVLPVVPASELQ